MLCEGASGYFSAPVNQPRRLTLSADAIADLQRHGFSTDDSTGNFQTYINLKGVESLAGVARLILTTFYEAYGARLRHDVEIYAPLAQLPPDKAPSCVPSS
jgi:hypothetical protein